MFWGSGFRGRPEGGVGFFGLDPFEITFNLAAFSKLPTRELRYRGGVRGHLAHGQASSRLAYPTAEIGV